MGLLFEQFGKARLKIVAVSRVRLLGYREEEEQEEGVVFGRL